MGPARIYPWRKMHRSRVPSIAPGTFFVAQSWADCITNMPGFNLRQAHGLRAMVQERPVRVERRLSAILAADVAGYSRLMHSDEEPTHCAIGLAKYFMGQSAETEGH